MYNKSNLYLKSRKLEKYMYKTFFVMFVVIIAILIYYFFIYDSKKPNQTVIALEKNNVSMLNKLNMEDLNGRILLLNNYKLGDISYIHSLNLAKKIQKEFKDKIVIIDIISDADDFNNNYMLNFVIKNSIARPVLNIPNFANEKEFILVNKNGEQVAIFDTPNFLNIKNGIDNLLKTTKRKGALSIKLEKDNIPEPFIKSLRFIRQWNNGLILVDSKGQRVYLTDLKGNILYQIDDFCYPASPTLNNNDLYIPDSCDNAIKKINLNSLNKDMEHILAIKQPLAINFFDDDMLIATANGIYKNDTLICSDCTNVFELEKYNDKIYFIHDGVVKFIDTDFTIKETDIKSNIGDNLHIDDTGIYTIDRFNNRIMLNGKIYNESNLYNFPTDITDYKDKLYITNEDGRNVLILDKITKDIKVLNITFSKGLTIKNDTTLTVDGLHPTILKVGNANKIIINLSHEYSFENHAPQMLMLLKEDKENNTAILVKEYDKNVLLTSRTLELPPLESGVNYYLNGTLYYSKKDEPCLIKKILTKIIANDDNTSGNVITLDFLY